MNTNTGLWCTLGLMAALLAGCQRVTESDVAWQQKLDDHAASSTTVLSAQIGDGEDSPAVRSQTSAATPSTPDAVCRAFLDSLARGDSRGATQYLTTTSLINARRAELVWQAPGGPQATYAVHAPRFATNKQTLATVDCTIRDTVDGQVVESELAWMLRLDANGWRICGIIVHLDEDGIPDLLSFENPDDVASIRAGMIDDEFVTQTHTNHHPE